MCDEIFQKLDHTFLAKGQRETTFNQLYSLMSGTLYTQFVVLLKVDIWNVRDRVLFVA